MKKIIILFILSFSFLYSQENSPLGKKYLLDSNKLLLSGNIEAAEKTLQKASELLTEEDKDSQFYMLSSIIYSRLNRKDLVKENLYLYFKKNRTKSQKKLMIVMLANFVNSFRSVGGEEPVMPSESKTIYNLIKLEKYEQAKIELDNYFKTQTEQDSSEYINMFLFKKYLFNLKKINNYFKARKNEKSKVYKQEAINEVPVYPGCEGSNSEKKKCLDEKMISLVSKNFNAYLAGDLNLPRGKCLERAFDRNNKIYCVRYQPKKYFIVVQFVIDEAGRVVEIDARAPHPKLKEEGIRIAKLIPLMKPGKVQGKPVRVGYTLPITFNVD